MGENIEIFRERKEQRSHYEIAQSKKKMNSTAKNLANFLPDHFIKHI